MKKRIFALCACVLVLLSVFAIPAFADYTITLPNSNTTSEPDLVLQPRDYIYVNESGTILQAPQIRVWYKDGFVDCAGYITADRSTGNLTVYLTEQTTLSKLEWNGGEEVWTMYDYDGGADSLTPEELAVTTLQIFFGSTSSTSQANIGALQQYFVIYLMYVDDEYVSGRFDSIEENAYNSGFNNGFDSGKTSGYNEGYAAAEELFNGDKGWMNLKNLIFAIFDAPFYVISQALNFELFGINVAGTLIALISIALVVWVLSIIIIKLL